MLTKLQKIDKIISEPKGKRIYGIIAGSDNFFHEILSFITPPVAIHRRFYQIRWR